MTGAKKKEVIKDLNCFSWSQKSDTIKNIVQNFASSKSEAGRFLQENAGITISERRLQVTGVPLTIPEKVDLPNADNKLKEFDYVVVAANERIVRDLRFPGAKKEFYYTSTQAIEEIVNKQSGNYKSHK